MKTVRSLSLTLLLAGSALVFTSCFSQNTLRNNNVNIGRYDIAVIDGCQYIVVGRNNRAETMSITHKGDCNNPIHRR
ncbi:hypothetical protein [Telluribacter sp. SYSU D00476]|uniref:hypothetical protein n=1 Tax=Telluribacter sp. SYSU D00476 TaxID=2811430 RepID=UPI001FF4465B|nr:hypothetical protein [Telluribacter sp. SYSU D00476]